MGRGGGGSGGRGSNPWKSDLNRNPWINISSVLSVQIKLILPIYHVYSSSTRQVKKNEKRMAVFTSRLSKYFAFAQDPWI